MKMKTMRKRYPADLQFAGTRGFIARWEDRGWLLIQNKHKVRIQLSVFFTHLSILLTTFFGFEWILYVCLKKCIWFHSIWHEDLLVIKASLCHWNCFSVFVLPNVVGLNSGVLFLCVENIVCYGLSSLAQCNSSSLIVLSQLCLSKLKQKLNRMLSQMIKTHYYSITSNVYTTLFRHLWARFLSEYLFIYVLL